jgi:predicted nucleic acid-binding protein
VDAEGPAQLVSLRAFRIWGRSARAGAAQLSRAILAILAARAWELGQNLSIYDASYVALAETTGLPLITLDKRLAKTPGTKCRIAAP